MHTDKHSRCVQEKKTTQRSHSSDSRGSAQYPICLQYLNSALTHRIRRFYFTVKLFIRDILYFMMFCQWKKPYSAFDKKNHIVVTNKRELKNKAAFFCSGDGEMGILGWRNKKGQPAALCSSFRGIKILSEERRKKDNVFALSMTKDGSFFPPTLLFLWRQDKINS